MNIINLARKILFTHSVWTFGLLYLLLLVLFPPNFRQYDNIFFTQVLMWGEPGVHTHCVSYFLMYPLSWIAALKPPFDPYTLFIFVLNGCTILLVARLLIHTKESPRFSHIGACLLAVQLFYCPFLFVEFAVVSCAAMAAGLLLLIRASRRGKTLISWAAVLFILLAATLRFDSCILLFPFLVIASCIEWMRGNKKILIYCGVALIGILTIYSTQHTMAKTSFWGNQEMDLSVVHHTRSSYLDYADVSSTEFQSKKQARYDEIGFTPALKDLFVSWNFQTPLRKDNEWWSALYEIYQSHDYTTPELVWARLKQGADIAQQFLGSLFNLYYLAAIFLPVVLATFFSVAKEGITTGLMRNSLGLLYLVLFVVLVAALCYTGRINNGSFLSVYFSCFIFILFSISNTKLKISGYRNQALTCAVMLPLFAFLPYTQRSYISKLFSPLRASYANPELIALLEKEMKQTPDLYYFAFAQSYRSIAIPSNLFCASNIRRYDHFLPMGDWESCLPYYENMLLEAGYESDIDIITADNARFVHTKKYPFLDKIQKIVNYHNEINNSNLQIVLDKNLGDDCKIYRIE